MFFPNTNITTVKHDLSDMVKKMRKANNLTQEDLAKKLNLSRITIQNVESGKNFTIDTLLLILQHFDQLESLWDYIKAKRESYDNTDSLY